MGYSFLADVNPIYCLYSSLFPTLIYALMGTSQYVSVGTFAALSIMTGSAIKETQILVSRERRVADSALFLSERNSSMANLVLPSDHSTTTVPINSAKPEVYSNEQIAFVCTFVVGIYLLLFGD